MRPLSHVLFLILIRILNTRAKNATNFANLIPAAADQQPEPSYGYAFRSGSPSHGDGGAAFDEGDEEEGMVDYGPVDYGAPSFNFRHPTDEEEEEEEEEPQHHHRQRAVHAPSLNLHSLNVDPHRVTLSGLSSGGGIAQQLLVSHPSLFSGLAIFQQTFYRCGRGDGDMASFDNFCTNLGNASSTARYSPQLAVNDIRAYAREGLIENPRLLQNKRLYVYAGTNNMILRLDQQLGLLRVFSPFIKNPHAIRTRVQHAASLLPTEGYGRPCDEEAEETAFLGACGFSGAFEALSFLIGEHQIKAPSKHANLGALFEFDQSEFFQGARGHSMARVGYIYVPSGCGEHRCLLHFYFHGCRAGADVTSGAHIRFSGFLEVAEANHIIVVFPQIQTHPWNPIGCWDSYGYTGPLYATARGVQIGIIRRLLLRILHGKSH